jgi:hypothetical protein
VSKGGCAGVGVRYGDLFMGCGGGQLLSRLPRALRNSENFDLFKKNSNRLELTRAKDGPPVLQKFKINYKFLEN